MDLTTKQRKGIPSKEFGIPPKGGKPGKYPMEDREHAILAKSFAKTEEEKGKLSSREEKKIVDKADRKLGEKPAFKDKIESVDKGKTRNWTAHKEAKYQEAKREKSR